MPRRKAERGDSDSSMHDAGQASDWEAIGSDGEAQALAEIGTSRLPVGGKKIARERKIVRNTNTTLTPGTAKQRLAAILYRRGDLVENPCAQCAATGGTFTQCVAVTGFQHSACTNCLWANRACSLRGTEIQSSAGLGSQYSNPRNLTPVDLDVLRSLTVSQRDDVEEGDEETCNWVLGSAAYRRWASGKSGVLWIKGKPGSGKSTLMSFLALAAQEDGKVVLKFFFNDTASEPPSTATDLLRSLVAQLYHQDEAVRPEIRKLFVEKYGLVGGDKDSVVWQQAELERLLQRAVVEAAQRRPVAVFADALDQAGARTGTELACYFDKIIDALPSNNLSCKICLSARHYPILATPRQDNQIAVDECNGDSIEAFVREALLKHDQVPDQPVEVKEAWKNLTQQLISSAKGVFQWVRLVVPEVKRKILEGRSPDEVSSWLRQVPQELQAKYRRIIETTIEHPDCEDAYLLFQWVCFAQHPLTVAALPAAMAIQAIIPKKFGAVWRHTRHLFASEAETKRRIIRLSGGLLEIGPAPYGTGECPQFIHPSAKDFFLGRGLCLLFGRVPLWNRVLPEVQRHYTT